MIEFHLLYFIVMFIAFLTGLFREFILFNSIILIHEIGHALAALYYKWVTMNLRCVIHLMN